MLVFTSCVNNYLPKARVLADSVKGQHPDWHFCLLLGEAPPPGFRPENEPFDRVLLFEEMGIPDYRSWYFQHRLVEICTAIKGRALNYFLEKEKQEKVIYLDPDILVTGSLQPLADLLDSHDVLLTPHQLAPQKGERAIQDNEICSLRHGIFNLGFVACANRGDGTTFSRFWRDRLADWCFDDKENGLFTDQKWCDLAPAYFPKLGIVRDPGCNAASWNLTDRVITRNSDGSFLANGTPLRFYHFTGYDSGMGQIMSKAYGGHMPAVAELWQLYEAKLKNAGQKKGEKFPWSGDQFSNGKKISDKARLYYRQNPAIRALFPDPFLTDPGGREGFAGHWAKHEAMENNRLFVWARKPFRLLNMTRLYLARNGGFRAVPQLAGRIGDIWRQEGLPGVIAKARKFRQKMGIGVPALTLEQLLRPPSQWLERLSRAFNGPEGVLLLDHMYGGGANDYREKRITDFLGEGRPVLLLTWDFFGSRLKCEFHLPDGSSIRCDASDLQDLLKYDQIRFGHILVNELVLWAGKKYRKDQYGALQHLLDNVYRIQEGDRATLEIAVHDFYSVCPNYRLLEGDTVFCNVPEPGEKCRKCLARSSFNVPEGFDLAAWRQIWKEAFSRADEVRTYSRETARLVAKGLDFPIEKIRVVPHAPLEALAPVAPPPVEAPMRIGAIGHIAAHKGAQIVRELAALLNEGESIAVIGELENNSNLPENVTVTGRYERASLPEIIRSERITSVLVPSIFPETFCYVLQECMQMELPVVVFPLGAQQERCRGYSRGLVASDTSARGALDAIRELESRRRSVR